MSSKKESEATEDGINKANTNEKTKQLLAFIVKNLGRTDRTSLMKLCYLIDLIAIKKGLGKVSQFEYRRYRYGPFDKNIYSYLQELTNSEVLIEESEFLAGHEHIVLFYNEEQNEPDWEKLKEEEKKIIKDVVDEVKGLGASTLTKIVYGTEPLKAMGTKSNNVKGFNQILNLEWWKEGEETTTAIEKEQIALSALDVAKYFLWKAKEEEAKITNNKINKLVYYAQAWNLVLKDKPLYGEDIEAWIIGPVIKKVYDKYKKFGFHPIQEEVNEDDIFQTREKGKEVLDEVWRVYGKCDADYLVTLTHQERPWQKAREGLALSKTSNNVISLDAMKKYYQELLNKFKGI